MDRKANSCCPNQTRNADSLPQEIGVQRTSLRRIRCQYLCPVHGSAENHQNGCDTGDQNGKSQIHTEHILQFPALIPAHISAVKDLGAADQHHADRVEKMIERPEHADGRHGRLANHIAGTDAVHNAVHGIDDNQQELIRKKLKILPPEHPIPG